MVDTDFRWMGMQTLSSVSPSKVPDFQAQHSVRVSSRVMRCWVQPSRAADLWPQSSETWLTLLQLLFLGDKFSYSLCLRQHLIRSRLVESDRLSVGGR